MLRLDHGPLDNKPTQAVADEYKRPVRRLIALDIKLHEEVIRLLIYAFTSGRERRVGIVREEENAGLWDLVWEEVFEP